MRLSSVAICVALAFPSAPVFAASQGSVEEEIVIVGETMRQAERQAKAYVAEVGIAVGEKPTARWVDPICPKAIGLSPAQEMRVVERVRAIARQVGARLAPPNCTGNLAVTFTDSATAVVEQLRRKGDRALAEVPKQLLDEMRNGAAPIRWWYQTDIRSRDGTSASGAVNPSLLMAVEGTPDAANLSQGDKGTLNVGSSSFISTQANRTIAFAAVVVDVPHARGASLDSIIDYAALVGLAEIRFGAAPKGSILSLFKPSNVVAELTNRDLAMLTGLYRIGLDRKAEQQRRTLVNAMIKPIVRESEETKTR